MTGKPHTETKFLDLDDDGLLDAVETTEWVAVDVDLDGTPDVVSAVAELDSAIGDDGVPERIETARVTAFRTPRPPMV